MTLKAPPEKIMEAFSTISNGSEPINASDLKHFVEEYFSPPGSDMVIADPPDWNESPAFIEDVYDKKLRAWLKDLNVIWKDLYRKVAPGVEDHPEQHTMIPLPNAFVIPGGRFREIYYWDTYWILEGLLLCGMTESAKGIIENFIFLVKNLGYVPNGTRKYYIGRSQPPFLIPMVDLYYSYNKDDEFLGSIVSVLEDEFNFWRQNRSVQVEYGFMNYTLYHYNVTADTPRAESFATDYNLHEKVAPEKKANFYANMKSAAESGWDFSSRWFADFEGYSSDILQINTRSIAPVDLNSLMCYNAHLLAKFYNILGNDTMSTQYNSIADDMNKTISRIFWDDEQGFWFDFDLDSNRRYKEFYASGFFPLWTNTFGYELSGSYIVDKVLNYLSNQIFDNNNFAGIPTSLRNSTQQWDYPVGWAPLQHIAILGLRNAAAFNATAGVFAEDFARKWVLNNFATYINTHPHAMLEKYDVVSSGGGSGGFYDTQLGFGWTNGVVMKLLSIYPHNILTHEVDHTISIVVGFFICLTLVTIIFCYCCRRIKFSKIYPFNRGMWRKASRESSESFVLNPTQSSENE